MYSIYFYDKFAFNLKNLNEIKNEVYERLVSKM